MRNDLIGQVRYYSGDETFFASGSKGFDIRANGHGGHLARGYYSRALASTDLLGPFNTRRIALNAAKARSAAP